MAHSHLLKPYEPTCAAASDEDESDSDEEADRSQYSFATRNVLGALLTRVRCGQWKPWLLVCSMLLLLILSMRQFGHALSCTVVSPSPHAASSFVRNFVRLQRRFQPLCGARPEQNLLLIGKEEPWTEERVWSFHPRIYHTHMIPNAEAVALTDEQISAARQSDAAGSDGEVLWARPLPFCSTTTQLLLSAQLGMRAPLDSATFPSVQEVDGFNPYRNMSFFTPHGCNFKWLSSMQACTVLHSYAYVLWEGDSMVRHTVQGLLMLLADDLQYGGMPRTGNTQVLNACNCDGAYSEALYCRAVNNEGFAFASPAAEAQGQLEGEKGQLRGYCPGFPTATAGDSLDPFHFHWEHSFLRSYSSQWDSLCNEEHVHLKNDRRPIAVYMSSGQWWHTNADETMSGLRGHFEALQRLRSSCAAQGRSVHVLWGGMGHGTVAGETEWPMQSDAKFREFDEQFKQMLHEQFADLQIDFMHWGPLMEGAPTSDGFHKLTEPNIIRAQYILNLMAVRANITLQTDDAARAQLEVM